MPAYGRTDSEWAELVEAGRDFLIEQARHRTLTHYTDLNRALVDRTGCSPFHFDLPADRAAIGHLLGLVVERDQEADPSDLMLSALVIHSGGNDPGTGFYQLAKDLKLLPMSASAGERQSFWVKQVQRLYERHAA
ncbi:hypothetical protein [Streptomyces bauhiniae]